MLQRDRHAERSVNRLGGRGLHEVREGVGFRQFRRAVSRGAFFRLQGKAAGHNEIRELLFEAAVYGKRKEHKKDGREIQKVEESPEEAGRKRPGCDSLCGQMQVLAQTQDDAP